MDAQSALTTAQGAFDRANAAVARAKVTASFAGTIVKVMHQEGDLVSPVESDPILRLVDPTRLQVAVRLSIAELQRVSAGQPATVGLPGSPGEPATVAMVPAPANAVGDVRRDPAELRTADDDPAGHECGSGNRAGRA